MFVIYAEKNAVSPPPSKKWLPYLPLANNFLIVGATCESLQSKLEENTGFKNINFNSAHFNFPFFKDKNFIYF